MDAGNPLAVEDHISSRLAAATTAHRDAQEVAQACAKRWRELVIEAVDGGLRIKDVAELARVSASRVHAILARADG